MKIVLRTAAYRVAAAAQSSQQEPVRSEQDQTTQPNTNHNDATRAQPSRKKKHNNESVTSDDSNTTDGDEDEEVEAHQQPSLDAALKFQSENVVHNPRNNIAQELATSGGSQMTDTPHMKVSQTSQGNSEVVAEVGKDKSSGNPTVGPSIARLDAVYAFYIDGVYEFWSMGLNGKQISGFMNYLNKRPVSLRPALTLKLMEDVSKRDSWERVIRKDGDAAIKSRDMAVETAVDLKKLLATCPSKNLDPDSMAWVRLRDIERKLPNFYMATKGFSIDDMVENSSDEDDDDFKC